MILLEQEHQHLHRLPRLPHTLCFGQTRKVDPQSTVSLGVRWDLLRSAALKLQYDRVMLGDGSHGVFGNVQPGFQAGSTVQLISASFDFVF